MQNRGKVTDNEPFIYRLLRYAWIPVVVILVVAVPVVGSWDSILKLRDRVVYDKRDATTLRIRVAEETPVELWATLTNANEGFRQRLQLKAGDVVDYQVPPQTPMRFTFSSPLTQLGEITEIVSPAEGGSHEWMFRTRPSEEGFYAIKAQRLIPVGDPEAPLIVEQKPLLASNFIKPITEAKGTSVPPPEIAKNTDNTELGEMLSRYVDVASQITSMSETGQIECRHYAQVFWRRGDVMIGCFGYSFRRSLKRLLADAEQREAGLLETHLQASATWFRGLFELSPQQRRTALMRVPKEEQATLQAQLQALVESKAMQDALAEQYLRHLGIATKIADRAELRSERALLMLFDGSLAVGGHVRQFPEWLRKHKPDAIKSTELNKLRMLQQFLIAPFVNSPSLARINRRGVLFADGQATIRGVKIDLDAIGVGFRDFRTGESL